MEFQQVSELAKKQFDKIQQQGKLFESSVTGQQAWDAYLEAFEVKKPFRDPASTENTCNICKGFFRKYGNIVAIKEDNTLTSMWDIELPEDSEYYLPVKTVADMLRNARIANVFLESYEFLKKMNYGKVKTGDRTFNLGLASNMKRYTREEAAKFGVVIPDKIYTFHHYHAVVSSEYIIFNGKSVEAHQAAHRSNKEVFLRSLVELQESTLQDVLEFIDTDAILNGKTYREKVAMMLQYKAFFAQVPEELRDNYAWRTSYKLPFSKFGNELIGTLCYDIQEKGIEYAVQEWNKRVDPVNFMRATAPIPESRKKAANKLVADLGLEQSFARRFATKEDIQIDEIRFVGRSKEAAKGLFDAIATKPSEAVKLDKDKLEKITIERFAELLANSPKQVEVYFENRHQNNLCTLTTAAVPDAPLLFKWNNPFSWTFNGNIAGKSMITQAVKEKGGNVTDALRFSILWNESGTDNSDLDAHAQEPNAEIYFSTFRSQKGSYKSPLGGFLDIDHRNPNGKVVVENIAYPDISELKSKGGSVRFFVHQWAERRSQGFKAEVIIEGNKYSYEYPNRVSGNINVATVTFKNGVASIEHHLPVVGVASSKVWNVDTNKFHNCILVCNSPNHWGENKVGNKHYMFLLQDCKTPEKTKGFHAENLREDLHEIRREIDVLSNLLMIQPAEEQLCGLGFNETVRDEVVIKIDNKIYLVTI